MQLMQEKDDSPPLKAAQTRILKILGKAHISAVPKRIKSRKESSPPFSPPTATFMGGLNINEMAYLLDVFMPKRKTLETVDLTVTEEPYKKFKKGDN